MREYCAQIWATRYFWTHLALSDLRARWRRSFLGAFWSIIQPLGMTLLLSYVFGRMFHTDITAYAPYILSGVIVWDFIVVTMSGGSLSFVQAESYIKQCRHPLAIYTLRTVLTALMVLLLASVSLVVWVLIVFPQNFGLCWLAALTIYPLLILIAWPLATLLGYLGTRFRDVPHAMALILQAMWFVSPVYFEAKLFRDGGLGYLNDYNPIYHILQIVRAPLLEGQWPVAQNYLFCLATAFVFGLLAILVGRKAEKKVIFYL